MRRPHSTSHIQYMAHFNVAAYDFTNEAASVPVRRSRNSVC